MSSLIDELKLNLIFAPDVGVGTLMDNVLEIVENHTCDWTPNERTTAWDGKTYTPSCGMARQPDGWIRSFRIASQSPMGYRFGCIANIPT